MLVCVLISLCSLSVSAEYKIEGWTPRYVYIEDDNLLGRTHYFGVSYFERVGAEFSGSTVRFGLGKRGNRINIGYTDGFSLMSVDFGLTYSFLEEGHSREYKTAIEGLGIELGLRFWVVQLIATHMEKQSFVSLAYGF